MAVHSFHIFDRRGKTLFTKRYVNSSIRNSISNNDEDNINNSNSNSNNEEEQRKLLFGMLFSLRELSSSLSPVDEPGDLQLVKTGPSTLYNYETVSGLRFVLYTTSSSDLTHNNNQATSHNNNNSTSSNSNNSTTTTPQSSSHGTSTANLILHAPTSTGLINSATAGTNPLTMNDSNILNSNSSSVHGNNSNNNNNNMTTNPTQTAIIRSSLKYIYEHIWVASVVRSPMYRPNCDTNNNSIKSTNFEATLDNYLKGMSWYR